MDLSYPVSNRLHPYHPQKYAMKSPVWTSIANLVGAILLLFT